MYQSNRSFNIPHLGHLTSFPAREGGNLIKLGNLIASLVFMLRVALIPRGVTNHDEDKPSCIQSERYPIRGGLAEKQRLAKICSVFEGIQEPFMLSLACKSVVYSTMFIYTASGA